LHMDVTPRKEAEAALWESEFRFRDAFENAALGLAMADAAEGGLIIENNVALERMLGRAPGSLVGQRFCELLHPEDTSGFDQQWDEMMVGRRAAIRLELRYPRENRAELLARVTLSPVHNSRGQINHALAIIEDVTERREAERRARAEQRLLRRILELNDKERRLLAYEIHDGLVQDLVAVKMVLEAQAERAARSSPDAPSPVVSPLRVLGRAIAEGRRLISDLRPMIIEEMGLVEALNYLVEELLAEGGLIVTFEHQVEFERLPELLEGTLYRIVQEALNNVRRHAATDQVRLMLRQLGPELELTIEDQGAGFELAAVPAERFGLRGIRERARLFGGHAKVNSQPGRGTRIHVVMPLDPPLDDLDQDVPDFA
jgi:PAS domain S-box-containing protein